LPIGGVGGLLAGLGIEVLNRATEEKFLGRVSKELVSLGKPSHLVQIYDFQHKYKLSFDNFPRSK
jgi:hypothetical protein